MRSKPHRLPEAAYRGHKTVSFTACIEDRKRPFLQSEIVKTFVGFLGEAIEGQRCIAPVYCFMPDHLHLLMFGQSPTSRIKVAMDQFKRKSADWFEAELPSTAWQANYHDHIVRNDEDLASHVQYVLANPVRAGLADEWGDYPFTGSIGIDLAVYLHDLDESRKFGC